MKVCKPRKASDWTEKFILMVQKCLGCDELVSLHIAASGNVILFMDYKVSWVKVFCLHLLWNLILCHTWCTRLDLAIDTAVIWIGENRIPVTFTLQLSSVDLHLVNSFLKLFY